MILTVSVHASFEKLAWQYTLSLLDQDISCVVYKIGILSIEQ